MTSASEPRITVAVPTYNRSDMLSRCLSSVLAQDYPDFRIVVVDNASDDDTEAVVRAVTDRRVAYVRQAENVGMLANWNYCIAANRSPYLSIFHDDDEMLPGFLRETADALDQHSTAGFAMTMGEFTSADGVRRLGHNSARDEAGLIPGAEWIARLIFGAGWPIWPSAVVMRASALARAGGYDSPHSRHSIDSNLYFRLAAQHDVAFSPRPLVRIWLHEGQESEQHFRMAGGTGWYAARAEQCDALAYLLQSPRADDQEYRRFLVDHLLTVSARRSEALHDVIPGLYWTWEQRQDMAAREVAAAIPPGTRFVQVDDGQWPRDLVTGRTALPFVERDGEYWGAPLDDAHAIHEMERLRTSGASHAAFGWPAFWWLDYYPGFHAHLREHFRVIARTSRVVVFDLRGR